MIYTKNGKMKRSKSGGNKKIKEFKESVRNLSYYVNSVWHFFQKSKSDFHTINFIASHIIDLIIWEIDEIDFYDFNYEPANEKEDEESVPIYHFINYLKDFAISIFNVYKNIQNILCYLSLTFNKITYKESSARDSIITNLFTDLKQFEVLIYSWRYSVDGLYKELNERMNKINKIRNSNSDCNHIKNRNVLCGLFPEFKKIATKKEFNLICKIIQLLTDKNTKYYNFCKQRNDYIHDGKSIFNYSNVELFYEHVDFDELIKDFTTLYAIFCSFCLNYLLIILWFKAKII